jgi:hypothetical protein
MIGDLKEVRFDKYCNKCTHRNESETDDICNECLENPGMEDSHKPLNFEEDTTIKTRKKSSRKNPSS